VLERLVEAGNSVVVIEHNLDVIKVCDHLIDLGPEGGDEGGQVIAEGSPEEVAAEPGSYTGRFLAKLLTVKVKRGRGAASGGGRSGGRPRAANGAGGAAKAAARGRTGAGSEARNGSEAGNGSRQAGNGSRQAGNGSSKSGNGAAKAAPKPRRRAPAASR
jgi:excinuclease ABC subunit A